MLLHHLKLLFCPNLQIKVTVMSPKFFLFFPKYSTAKLQVWVWKAHFYCF